MRGTYTRWTRTEGGPLRADILGSKFDVRADSDSGRTILTMNNTSVQLDPDEARMIGVRLIEAAALSDGDRSVRLIL